MNTSNFFGVRKARGASHLVVPEPPKKVTPPAEVAHPKVKRRKTAKPKAKTTEIPQAIATAVSAAAASFQGDSTAQTQAADKPKTTPPIHEMGFVNDDHRHNMVGYFDTEES